MPKSRAGGDVCEGSGRDRDTRPKHVERRPPQVFQKSLPPKDIEDMRNDELSISNDHAAIFCPSNERGVVEGDLKFYYRETKPWTTHLSSNGDRCCLTQGWSQFARMKKLKEGDIITFYAIMSGSGSTKEREFVVTVTQ